MVEEWSNACPALKDHHDFKSMSLVVESMGSNLIGTHFFRQSEADPDCDFMSSIFLRTTDAFVDLCFGSN